MMQRFNYLWTAAGTVQWYVRVFEEKREYKKKIKAAVRIQSSFRGWLVKNVILWEKLKVLAAVERAWNERETKRMRRRAEGYVGVGPLSVVSLTCLGETRQVYPQGWLKSYEDILRQGKYLRGLAFGAEHTVALVTSSASATRLAGVAATARSSSGSPCRRSRRRCCSS